MFLRLFTHALLACPALIVAGSQNVTFVNPTKNNGTFFLNANNGFGEPLNVIISGTSSPEVLTNDGFLSFARAVGFTTDCPVFPSSNGNPFTANLGDGQGPQATIFELRESFGNFLIGACIETLLGGNHFRMFRQNGTKANTGALFLATSWERTLFQNHTIAPNGYDIGRDHFVNMAVGMTSCNGTTYNTTFQNLTGVMPVGSNGVNHGIAVDGNAVLLSVAVAQNSTST